MSSSSILVSINAVVSTDSLLTRGTMSTTIVEVLVLPY